MSRIFSLAVLVCAFLVPCAAQAAKVYRCPGPTGSMVFSQFPCPVKPAVVAAESPVDEAAGTEATAADAAPDCAGRSNEINERFSSESAAATRDIRRLREQMAASGGYSADHPNTGLRAELTAAEDRLDAAGRTHRDALLDMRAHCSKPTVRP